MTPIAFAFVAVVLFVPPAAAGEDEPRTQQQNAVRVYVDPATGQRSARPPESARHDGAEAERIPDFRQSTEGLVEQPAPDGGVIVDLQGRFQSATMIRVGNDGKREVYCTDATHENGKPHRHDEAATSDPAER